MCGLVGMIAKRRSGFFGDYDNYFKEILYIDALRGDDSTGVFSVDTDGDVSVLKEASIPQYFCIDSEYNKWSKGIVKDHLVTVGHNRKATQGKVNDANAHPFVVNNEFVFVHNGTLTYHNNLEEKGEVDSEVLAKYIHRETPADVYDSDAWSKVFDKVYGAYALIWYDMRCNKLFVLRNSQRPLIIGETEDSFLLCSEGSFINAAAGRNKIKVDKYTAVPEKKILVFDLDSSEDVLSYKEVAVVALPFQQTTTTATDTYTTFNNSKQHNSKRVKAIAKELVGTKIQVKIEDVVEQAPNSCDYYFYGSAKDVKYIHDVVGELDSSESVNVVCSALYVGEKECYVTCEVLSVERQATSNKIQINVRYVSKHEQTQTTH